MRVTEDNVKVLLILGSLLAAIGSVLDIITFAGYHHPDAQLFVGPIVVITISVLILIMLGIIQIKNAHIPLKAWLMLIFILLEIFLSGAALFSIVGIGIILEIVATTMLAMLE